MFSLNTDYNIMSTLLFGDLTVECNHSRNIFPNTGKWSISCLDDFLLLTASTKSIISCKKTTSSTRQRPLSLLHGILGNPRAHLWRRSTGTASTSQKPHPSSRRACRRTGSASEGPAGCLSSGAARETTAGLTLSAAQRHRSHPQRAGSRPLLLRPCANTAGKAAGFIAFMDLWSSAGIYHPGKFMLL